MFVSGHYKRRYQNLGQTSHSSVNITALTNDYEDEPRLCVEPWKLVSLLQAPIRWSTRLEKHKQKKKKQCSQAKGLKPRHYDDNAYNEIKMGNLSLHVRNTEHFYPWPCI